MNLKDLRKSLLFQGLSDEELQQLVAKGERVSFRDNDVLIQQGDIGDCAYVILNGEFDIHKQSGQSMIRLDTRKAGDVVGEMALITRAPRTATIIARTDSEALRIPQDAFDRLLSSSPTAARTILHLVMERLIQNEALLHQHEKMVALGNMTAGLAHELNNPAVAAQRSASQLQEAQSNYLKLTHEIETLAIQEGQTEWLRGFMQEASRRFGSPLKLEALEKIDLVDQLQEWLEANGIASAWELAPAMVNFGWDAQSLELFRNPALFDLSIQWLGAGCLSMGLLADVLQATERISKIVHAMKSYTYLDQAPLLEVDVHEGLENTLTIMQHKLRKGVTVKRDYAPDLPRIEAFASELNQVWTNIIDNAVDAMDGSGEIILRTYAEDDCVVVEITDNGPGIPAEICKRIFEPFFTTKPPGQGTGLGLHISHNIIAARHRGQLSVESKPGRTTFKATLPVRIATEKENPAMNDEMMKEILLSAETIAVVGLSSNSVKPSYSIAEYLKRQGYLIIPVNPMAAEIMGETSYPDLTSIPEKVDVVQVFRKPEDVPPVVEEAIKIGAKVVWMQEGISHDVAALSARNAGLQVVMDTCMRSMHRKLIGEK
jgi:signal transduction histidine kinase/predicted CoA-binding protein